MGLTIHYEFSFLGKKEELFNKLQWLSTEFQKLPVTKVYPVELSRKGYELSVDVGPGCEWFAITLESDGKDEWSGRGFTKTEFAVDFKSCHSAIVRMLDLCKEAGILKTVNDESGYWENRDQNSLGKDQMGKGIWDLKIGQKFVTLQRAHCEVITPTQDGKGLLAKYLDGDLIGQEDFVFESEIDFMSSSEL